MWCVHSADWWRRHWERTGIVDVEVADTMPDGWKLWLEWHKVIAPENQVEIQALEADQGKYLGYIRCVGPRRGDANLADQIVYLPTQYSKKPLLCTGAEPNGHCTWPRGTRA